MNKNRMPMIAGNWKMNLTRLEAVKLARRVGEMEFGIEVVLCPPFVYLEAIRPVLGGSKLGSQNAYYEKKQEKKLKV